MKRYEIDWVKVTFFSLVSLTVLCALGGIWLENPKISENCWQSAYLFVVLAGVCGLKIFVDWMES